MKAFSEWYFGAVSSGLERGLVLLGILSCVSCPDKSDFTFNLRVRPRLCSSSSAPLRSYPSIIQPSAAQPSLTFLFYLYTQSHSQLWCRCSTLYISLLQPFPTSTFLLHIVPSCIPAIYSGCSSLFSPGPVPASLQLANIYHPGLTLKPFGSQIGGWRG